MGAFNEHILVSTAAEHVRDVLTDIRFSLNPIDGKTLLSVSPNYTLRYGWLEQLLGALFVRSQYCKGMQRLLEGLKDKVEREHRSWQES